MYEYLHIKMQLELIWDCQIYTGSLLNNFELWNAILFVTIAVQVTENIT